MRSAGVRRAYEQELLLSETGETLSGLVEHAELTRQAFADRLGVTAGRVTQLLSGAANLTLASVADAAWALGYRAMVLIEPLADRAQTPAFQDPAPPQWLERVNRQWMPDALGQTTVSIPSESVTITYDSYSYRFYGIRRQTTTGGSSVTAEVCARP
jgi:transcriptional regulator with XRE-family HTH domain